MKYDYLKRHGNKDIQQKIIPMLQIFVLFLHYIISQKKKISNNFKIKSISKMGYNSNKNETRDVFTLNRCMRRFHGMVVRKFSQMKNNIS